MLFFLLLFASEPEIPTNGTLGAYILAIIGVLGTIHAKWDTHRAKKQADKVAIELAKNDRRRELAKLKHDQEIATLRAEHQACEDSWKRITHELEECREQHQKSDVKHQESEKDREELRLQVQEIKKELSNLKPV